jgi:hypothetical protein
LDLSLPIALASALMTLVLSFQAYRAFKYAKRDYLLNFSVGFLLLTMSYALLIPLALGVKLPANFQDADDIINYPAFAFMQTIAYGLIALAYSQTTRSRQTLFGLVGLLGVVVFASLIPGMDIIQSVDIVLYLINLGLLGFVLYHMMKFMPPTNLVFAGFLFLAIHQYTVLLGSLNEAIYNYTDDGTFLIATSLRLIAFGFMFVSFFASRRRPRNDLLVRRISNA